MSVLNRLITALVVALFATGCLEGLTSFERVAEELERAEFEQEEFLEAFEGEVNESGGDFAYDEAEGILTFTFTDSSVACEGPQAGDTIEVEVVELTDSRMDLYFPFDDGPDEHDDHDGHDDHGDDHDNHNKHDEEPDDHGDDHGDEAGDLVSFTRITPGDGIYGTWEAVREDFGILLTILEDGRFEMLFAIDCGGGEDDFDDHHGDDDRPRNDLDCVLVHPDERTVVVDGDIDDWGGRSPLAFIQDDSSDSQAQGAEIRELWFGYDSSYYTFLFDLDSDVGTDPDIEYRLDFEDFQSNNWRISIYYSQGSGQWELRDPSNDDDHFGRVTYATNSNHVEMAIERDVWDNNSVIPRVSASILDCGGNNCETVDELPDCGGVEIDFGGGP